MKKMKSTLLVTLLFTSFVYSQSSSTTNVSDNNALALSGIAGSGGNSAPGGTYGTAMRFVNPPRTMDGSIYLFEDWKNYPVIVKSKDNKTFTLDNVNFNLRTNRLVTKISQDSIFVLNMKKIDNINILGKVFKKIDSEIGSRVFEVIYESDKVSILNFHSVKLVEGSVNPMLSRKNDKLIHKEVYYLMNDSGITEFRLKKKFILDSFANNEAEKKSLLKYYSQNKLSFKNLNDLKNVLNNIDNIL
ncbi:hypothetical protein OAC80_00315 [Flavobacteriaceae bacterium]|jgi:hypothetical protein|nr:hypothetical protein [Flavobacteriaceae bacterium]